MKKVEVRRLGLGSVFRLFLVMGLIIGLIVSIAFFLTGHAVSAVGRDLGTMTNFMSIGNGAIACVATGIAYGLGSGITAVIGALLYNIFAAAVGGVTIRIADKD